MRTVELVRDMNRILLKSCSDQARHLLESEVDVEPRHEAFWMCGGKFRGFVMLEHFQCYCVFYSLYIGIEPPTDKKIWIERKKPLTEEEKNEPVDRPFQYVGK